MTLTITLPGGTTVTPSPVHTGTGVYAADYAGPTAGRYTAHWVATGANLGAADDVWDVTGTGLAYVTPAVAIAYLGDTSWGSPDITDALEAERAAQAARCYIDPYPADLRQALLRRVARNLAARAVPIAQYSSFEGVMTGARVPMQDAEIARLEGPYLRVCVG
jgi:hypothetical protein